MKWEMLANGGAVAMIGGKLAEITPSDDDDDFEVYHNGKYVKNVKNVADGKKLFVANTRKNPIKSPIIEKALKLRAGFRATAGTRKDKKPRIKSITAPKKETVIIGIGKTLAIEYQLVDEHGKPIKGQAFRHEFTGSSQPMLATGYDGKQLYFVGGKYRFKTDGINDQK